MKKQFIANGIEPKWKNYRRYIKPIFANALNETQDQRLNFGASIILVDATQIHQLNLQFRNVDRPTDVLTFVDDEPEYLGDIFINVEAVLAQAAEYKHSIKREFCFLVTHGVLHLLGYDHHTPAEEKVMFDLQERILKPIASR